MKKEQSSTHRTVYEPIYRLENGQITSEYPDTTGQYDVAAIKTIYNLDKVVSRDMLVNDGCWVDSNEENAFKKAIALRNA